MLNEITLKNFRCFRDQQTARLAPLTLLVGENSAGKTSFLALIQVLLELTLDAYRNPVPNFKKSPYDLGTFDEIAHYRGGRSGRANTFNAGFSICGLDSADRTQYFKNSEFRIDIEFGRGSSTVPVPIGLTLSSQDTYIKVYSDDIEESSVPQLHFGTSNGSWKVIPDLSENSSHRFIDSQFLTYYPIYFDEIRSRIEKKSTEIKIDVTNGVDQPTNSDLNRVCELVTAFHPFAVHREGSIFSSAPVRSKPQRTYDPADVSRNPDGDYIPMYMANKYFENKNDWKKLQASLVEFGKSSGLFDEIGIKPLGKKGSEPFQLIVRKFGDRSKGPSRNLIDVGYGVSQVLPIIAELSQDRASSVNLIQQPEVHLHPSAQAALGSFFCRAANAKRALVVETHSDYILDRVRMEIRDKSSNLKPEDVSILFFERKNLGAQVYSLRIDEAGNICDAPKNYRDFFLEETKRSLGL